MFVQLESQLSPEDQNLIAQDLQNIALAESGSNSTLPGTFSTVLTDAELKQELGPMIKADLKDEEGVLLVVDKKEDIKNSSNEEANDLAETAVVVPSEEPDPITDVQLENIEN